MCERELAAKIQMWTVTDSSERMSGYGEGKRGKGQIGEGWRSKERSGSGGEKRARDFGRNRLSKERS